MPEGQDIEGGNVNRHHPPEIAGLPPEVAAEVREFHRRVAAEREALRPAVLRPGFMDALAADANDWEPTATGRANELVAEYAAGVQARYAPPPDNAIYEADTGRWTVPPAEPPVWYDERTGQPDAPAEGATLRDLDRLVGAARERPAFQPIAANYITYGAATPGRTRFIGGTLEDTNRLEAVEAPRVDIQGGYSTLRNHPVQQSAEARQDYLLGLAAPDDVDFGGVFGRTDSPSAYAYLLRGGG